MKNKLTDIERIKHSIDVLEEIKTLDDTLYAYWVYNSYSVKFNGNGATSGSMTNQSFTYGITQALKQNSFVKTGFDFIVNQLEFSITSTQLIDDILNMNTNDELANDKSGDALIYCYLNNISLQAWSPLKVSLSEGSFINNPKYVELNNYLDELANKYNASKVSIALSFIYRLPFNITPVVGVSSINHLKDALKSKEINLSKEEWYKLYLIAGHKLP